MNICIRIYYKSYCSTVQFRRITSIYQPKNAHIISHKTLLKHFKPLRHVSILSDHHHGALFLAKVILRYSQFNSYLQTRCCGSISCCVGMCCGAVARCASYDAHLARNKAPWWWSDKIETCRSVLKCFKVFYVKLYVYSLVDKLKWICIYCSCSGLIVIGSGYIFVLTKIQCKLKNRANVRMSYFL